jgi:hypothetical protein
MHPPQAGTDVTFPQMVDDSLRQVLGRGRLAGPGVVLAVLAVVGIAAVVWQIIVHGFGTLQPWTYCAIAFGYLLITAGGAPVVIVTIRVSRGQWRRPMARVAEFPAACGLVTLLLFIPLLIVVPPIEGRNTIWTVWPWGAPRLWDAILVTLLVLSGYALLYLSAIPDLAVASEHVGGSRGRWYRWLARDWRGTQQQWLTLERGISVLGGLYAVLYVGVVTIVALDFGMSLLPGWMSAVFPSYVVMTGFEAALALVVVLMAALRRWGGMAAYLDRDQFHAMSKLMLTMALLWFYFWWSSFIVLWYGRLPEDVHTLEVMEFRTYRVLFFLVFALLFLFPLLVLMWNPARKSIRANTIVAIGILLGTLVDLTRIFSASFAPFSTRPEDYKTPPPAYVPTLIDLLILLGGIAAALALLVLTLRLVPLPSIWEMGASLPLRVKRKYLHTEVAVVGKPD